MHLNISAIKGVGEGGDKVQGRPLKVQCLHYQLTIHAEQIQNTWKEKQLGINAEFCVTSITVHVI